MMYKIKKFLLICIIFFISTYITSAQSQISIEEYINTYSSVALEHMYRYHIPASIKLAQAIIESSFGNSDLARNANNHFGVKCHNWEGESYFKDDDAKNECFRKYNDPISSFIDHSLFLTTKQRYAFLFELDITDYRAWAEGLKQAGYATNPRYPELLIGVIERNNLHLLDKGVLLDSSFVLHVEQSENDSLSSLGSLVPTQRNRIIKLNNRVKYINALSGDTPERIAEDLDMGVWQIYRYNDLRRGEVIRENTRIYLQPKRRRSYEYEKHIVVRGETLKSISDKYAVKVSHLFRLNPDMHPDGLISEGQVIFLKRKVRLNRLNL
ncbi:MAG: glucosaminidase domain-containing protein [Bacteroidales bacterium]|nr:glucosaminidase domain-containing protein [Bacteroidales bacterium]